MENVKDQNPKLRRRRKSQERQRKKISKKRNRKEHLLQLENLKLIRNLRNRKCLSISIQELIKI